MAGLGEKDKLVGTILRETIEKGLGNTGYVLEQPNGVKLQIVASCEVGHELDDKLKSLVGKPVVISGIPGSGRAALFVNGVSDILPFPTPKPRGLRPGQ